MIGLRKIGIIGAMPEEINAVIKLLTNRSEETIGKRTYYSGFIDGIATVVVFSRWGKVAAATTVTTLIQHYGITELIFTGVAGAINPLLNIGDVVLGDRLIQHDMDARPLMEQYEIPLLGKIFFETDKKQSEEIAISITEMLESKNMIPIFTKEALDNFNIKAPKLYRGDIASGDQFFSNNNQKENLHSKLPSVLCVEMEGAAAAQVCFEYEIPFRIVRIISDVANENSHLDFPLFIKDIASKYTFEIIKRMYSVFSDERL